MHAVFDRMNPSCAKDESASHCMYKTFLCTHDEVGLVRLLHRASSAKIRTNQTQDRGGPTIGSIQASAKAGFFVCVDPDKPRNMQSETNLDAKKPQLACGIRSPSSSASTKVSKRP
jgi:hypothetical protein